MHYIYIKQFNNISLMTFMRYLKYWCVCIDSLIVILLANQIILEPTLLVYSVTVQLLFNFSLLQGIYAPRIQRLKWSLQLTQLDRLITCTVSGNCMWLPFQYYRTYTRERFNNTRTCSCWGQEEGGGRSLRLVSLLIQYFFVLGFYFLIYVSSVFIHINITLSTWTHSCSKPLLIRHTYHVYNLQYKHIKNLETNANPFIKVRLIKKRLLSRMKRIHTCLC